MKHAFLLLSFFVLTKITFSQVIIPQKYYEKIKTADSLYNKDEYRESANEYSQAFKLLGWKGFSNDRYKAACSWALVGVKDSSFLHLNYIANKQNYSAYDIITNDPDLRSLHHDQRWKALLNKIKQNQIKEEAQLNKPLAAQLDTIYFDDLKYRLQIDAIEKAYGSDSPEMKRLEEIINKKDAINLIKVTSILDEHGWLGSEVVGENGNYALFSVIQHSDLSTQERYLPLMREAARNGNLSPAALASLEDRIALRQGKKQIYGTQMGIDPETNLYYVVPFEDPDNIDKRRAAMRLPPLADQLNSWGVKWDLEQYKIDLPMLEEKVKQTQKKEQTH